MESKVTIPSEVIDFVLRKDCPACDGKIAKPGEVLVFYSNPLLVGGQETTWEVQYNECENGHRILTPDGPWFRRNLQGNKCLQTKS